MWVDLNTRNLTRWNNERAIPKNWGYMSTGPRPSFSPSAHGCPLHHQHSSEHNLSQRPTTSHYLGSTIASNNSSFNDVNRRKAIATSTMSKLSYNNHTRTYQHPVGMGLHCQLRQGGHPRHAGILNCTYLHNKIAIQLLYSKTSNNTTAIQQPNTDTLRSKSIIPFSLSIV